MNEQFSSYTTLISCKFVIYMEPPPLPLHKNINKVNENRDLSHFVKSYFLLIHQIIYCCGEPHLGHWVVNKLNIRYLPIE